MSKKYSFINFSIGPSVHFYVNQEKSECLLIATADGSNIINEKFNTASHCSRDELNLITMNDIIFIRIMEVIFCLKDLLSNEQNFGWLHPSKRLLIIDFQSIMMEQ
jgi:hypothetical protein